MDDEPKKYREDVYGAFADDHKTFGRKADLYYGEPDPDRPKHPKRPNGIIRRAVARLLRWLAGQ